MIKWHVKGNVYITKLSVVMLLDIHKRCQICELFVKWDGVFCPCCGRKLRIGPRSFKLKAKLRKQKQIQEANKKVLYRLYDLEKEISVTNIVRN